MKDLQTFLKKFNRGTEGQTSGFGTGPEADWRIIFVSFVILVAIVIASCVFIFRGIDKGDIFTTEAPEAQEEQILDTSLLKETVLYYQNKALELKKLKNSTLSSAGSDTVN